MNKLSSTNQKVQTVNFIGSIPIAHVFIAPDVCPKLLKQVAINAIEKLTESGCHTQQAINDFFHANANGDKDGLLIATVLRAIVSRLESPMAPMQLKIVNLMVTEIGLYLDGFASAILDTFLLNESVDRCLDGLVA